MRQISILEVLDPFTNKYIKVSDAIEKGIFDRNTYQYFDPIQQKVYSITDAAKRGLYKTCVNTDPNCIVLEKIRVAQTLSLKNAVDPYNANNMLKIKDAIRMRIVDLETGVYRNPKTKQEIQLSEAIELNLIGADVVKESFEKIRETLVEKNKQNERRNVETYMTITEDAPFGPANPIAHVKPLMDKCLDAHNNINTDNRNNNNNKPVYYDQTKFEESDAQFVYSSKLRNQITAALIKDSRSNRIIDLSEAISTGIIDTATGIYYDSKSNNQIDLTKAIDKGLVILPDSECLVTDLDRVMDLKTGSFVDYRMAVDNGIVDLANRTYLNTKTNRKMSLFNALTDNLIKLCDEYTKAVTIADVRTVFDPITGEQISKQLAIEQGLLNSRLNMYVEQKTMRLMPLKEAYEKGIVVLERDAWSATCRDDEKAEIMRINGVYDPHTGQHMHLKDAISKGVLDYTECVLNVKSTGEKLTLQSAYDRGMLVTVSKPEDQFHAVIEHCPPNQQQRKRASTSDDTLSSFADNSQGLKMTTNDSNSQTTSQSMATEHPSGTDSVLDFYAEMNEGLELVASHAKPDSDSEPDLNTTTEGSKTSGSTSDSDLDDDVDDDNQVNNNNDNETKAKVLGTSEQVNKTRVEQNVDIIRSYESEIQKTSPNKVYTLNLTNKTTRFRPPQTSFTIEREQSEQKDEDAKTTANVAHMSNKHKSLMSNIREKMFGHQHPQPLTQIGQLDDMAIINSLVYVDSRSQKEYSLTRACEKHFILGPDSIVNMVDNSELNMKDALSQSIIYFSIDDSLRMTKLGNSFVNGNNLYIIYHVLDPQTRNKLTLYESILKGLLNRNSASYTCGGAMATTATNHRQLPISIEDAIERGHIAGAIVSLQRLRNLLARYTSNTRSLVNKSSESAQSSVSSGSNVNHRRSLRTSTIKTQDNEKTKKAYSIDNVDDATSAALAVDARRLPITVVRKLPKKYDHTKAYSISTVYDKLTKTHVGFDMAVANGIYNPFTQEYLNKKSQKTMHVKKAIRRGYVQIHADEQDGQLTDDITTSSKSLASLSMKPTAYGTTGARMHADNNQESTSVTVPSDVILVKPIGNLPNQAAYYQDHEPSFSNGVAKAKQLSPTHNNKINDKPTSPRQDPYDSRHLTSQKYLIISCYDTSKGKDVSYEQAVNTGLYNPITNEYYDTKSKKHLSLEKAVECGKMKIFKYATAKKKSIGDRLDDQPVAVPPSQTDIERQTTNGPNWATDESGVNLATTPQEHLHLDSNFLKKLLEPTEIKASEPSVDFDLIKSISYQLPRLNKYLDFRQMIERNLYDPTTGKIKNMYTNEYLTFNEALGKAIVTIASPNVIYDKFNLYYINGVFDGVDRFVTLNDAIMNTGTNKLIDKAKCTYRHKRTLLTIQIAIRMGYINGHVYDVEQVHAIMKRFYDDEVQLTSSKQATGIDRQNNLFVNHKSLFDRLRVYDAGCQSYIVLMEAILMGLVDVNTGRIKEAKTGVFVPFKEAIINGLISTYAIQHRSAFYMHNASSYIIDSIYDPRQKLALGINEAVRRGLFSNGVYKNLLTGQQYDLDRALETGVYVIGTKIDLATVEQDFLNFLDKFKTKVQMKTTMPRMIPNAQQQQKQQSFTTPIGNNIQFAKDTRTGRLVPVQEAERIGLLNLSQGWFKNTQRMQSLSIADAIEQGLVLFNTVSANQYVIKSIMDPKKKVELSIENAIKQGLYDMENAIYFDETNKKKLSIVDAIEQGFVRIANVPLQEQTSFKINIENDDCNGSMNNSRSCSIRYVANLDTKQIIPIAQAIKFGIVDLERGIMHHRKTNKAISLREAYDTGLVFTADDLDDPLSDRIPILIHSVRNCNNGKDMSLKTALARNWISITRRLYINKYSGQEMPLSQALDMDLIVLMANIAGLKTTDNMKPKISVIKPVSTDTTDVNRTTHTAGLRKKTQQK